MKHAKPVKAWKSSAAQAEWPDRRAIDAGYSFPSAGLSPAIHTRVSLTLVAVGTPVTVPPLPPADIKVAFFGINVIVAPSREAACISVGSRTREGVLCACAPAARPSRSATAVIRRRTPLRVQRAGRSDSDREDKGPRRRHHEDAGRAARRLGGSPAANVKSRRKVPAPQQRDSTKSRPVMATRPASGPLNMLVMVPPNQHQRLQKTARCTKYRDPAAAGLLYERQWLRNDDATFIVIRATCRIAGG